MEREVNTVPNARQIGLVLLLGCAVVVLSFAYLDVPIARWFSQNLGHLGAGLSSATLLSLDAATALFLVAERLVRGQLSAMSKTLAIACLTSMCAYAVNDGVLKLFFGVPNPSRVLLEGARHTFHFLSGDRDSSFPSGHMVLAGSFAGVFMRLYPSSIWPTCALLLFGSMLLIVGDWHFASDVIAGAFLGVSTGALAGELWRVHSN